MDWPTPYVLFNERKEEMKRVLGILNVAALSLSAFASVGMAQQPSGVNLRRFAPADPARPEQLLGGAPPPERDLDLVLCRNVVIYFERATQDRVFELFAGALAPGGYLILGKVESLSGPARQQLTLLDPRERVYQRAA